MRKSATYEQTTTWKPVNAGDKIDGVYIRKEEFEYNSQPTVKYVIESEGKKYGVFGTAALKRQFANIPEGSYVWIEYTGVSITKNNRSVKTFKVDYDDEYQA